MDVISKVGVSATTWTKMAVRKVMEVFQQELRRANLSKDSPVGEGTLNTDSIPLLWYSTAIGLSGGADSMALLWLAKQLFSNVVGLTVDHRYSISVWGRGRCVGW